MFAHVASPSLQFFGVYHKCVSVHELLIFGKFTFKPFHTIASLSKRSDTPNTTDTSCGASQTIGNRHKALARAHKSIIHRNTPTVICNIFRQRTPKSLRACGPPTEIFSSFSNHIGRLSCRQSSSVLSNERVFVSGQNRIHSQTLTSRNDSL